MGKHYSCDDRLKKVVSEFACKISSCLCTILIIILNVILYQKVLIEHTKEKEYREKRMKRSEEQEDELTESLAEQITGT